MRRRQFLTALALGSAGVLLPPLHRRARAELDTAPRRVIFMMTQHGTWYPNWAFNPAGLPEDQSWSFGLGATSVDELSPALAPLHAFRDRLTILDGLALASGDADPATALRHDDRAAPPAAAQLPRPSLRPRTRDRRGMAGADRRDLRRRGPAPRL